MDDFEHVELQDIGSEPEAYTYRASGWEQISPHVVMPTKWETINNQTDGGMLVDLRAEWSPDAFAYELKEVRVRKESGSVTATDLRQLSLAQLVERTNRFMASFHATTMMGVDGGEVSAQEVIDVLRDNVFYGRGPTPETLEQIAILYEIAVVLGANPVREIEKLFGLAPRTATHWVKLARERGHLDERIMKRGKSRAS